MRRALLIAIAGPATLSAGAAFAGPGDATVLVDGFEAAGEWTAHPADGVQLSIESDTGWKGRCLRLDFRFLGGGGYAVARKELALDLPENYTFTFRLRGEAPPNHLEFKLIDEIGENVWWSVQRNLDFPREWEAVSIKKRRITFAWGPRGGGELRHVAAIEFAITAGSGGEGTVWIDELELRPLPPSGGPFPPPVARASSEQEGSEAAQVLDSDPATHWAPVFGDPAPRLWLDFTQLREFGGLIVDWVPGRHAPDYEVEISDDGASWTTLRTVRGGNGERDYLYLPETDARFLRLATPGGSGTVPAVAGLEVKPLAWSASREAFFQAVAGEAPRGRYPRGFSGEQAYWTVVGVDGGLENGLLGEDGAIEPGRGGYSVEPFLFLADSLVTWADVEAGHFLEGGSLPIPTVTWSAGTVELTVTAFGTGPRDASTLAARYRIRNRGRRSAAGTLFLAVRPFQVNPPTQTLNAPGGTARIGELAISEDGFRVNGRPEAVCLDRPSGVGAVTFDEGGVVTDFLEQGRLPEQLQVHDPFEAASGALAFPFRIQPHGSRTVRLLFPLHRASPCPETPGRNGAWMEERESGCREAWRETTRRVRFEGPEEARVALESVASQLAYVLVERAGPAIRPGTRSYARSWIRDGALTGSALLRLGHAEKVLEFIEWYAPYQYASGKIPCVVDARGADPVPEHDSSGEFIFLVAEYVRYTGDRALAERMWPRIAGAVAYLDSLRQERRTPAYRTPETIEFYGLLPPSISHEGYSAKPMHSYWDDFFAFRGFRDAVYLAALLGLADEERDITRIRDEFTGDLAASVAAAMERHGIDYVPGCADLGDFDATSTTIALDPTGAADILPRPALERTFERYYAFFRERRDGAPWDAFTPYEIRNIGAFVRLGWRDRAGELLDFFLGHQHPPGWRQWAEVVGSEPRTPRFIGDLPHSWVGSDYIRSVLDMFAYVRETDEALVVAAGIPRSWVAAGEVAAEDLCTPYGRLSVRLRSRGSWVEVILDGDLRVPPGGIRVVPPLDGPARTVLVNRARVEPGMRGEILVRELPARVRARP